MLTSDNVRQLFDYNPETGVLTNKVRRSASAGPGQLAGAAGLCNGKMYRTVQVHGKNQKVHRVIWLYMTGELPPCDIDHINGDGMDNRWINLRAVTRLENLRNCQLPKTNKSGHVGVCWNAGRSKWQANMRLKNKNIYLGLYVDINDAIKAAQDARAAHGFHPNHGRRRP